MENKKLKFLAILLSVSFIGFGQNWNGGRTTLGGVNVDAFSRLRVSDPVTIFAVQSQYNANPLQMESGAFGTGVTPSYSTDTRMVELTVNAGTGTSFTQSYQYLPYQPGKSQLIKITGVAGVGVANTTVDFMYGDSLNGIIIRQNGASDFQVIRRTKTTGSIVDTVVNRANWTDKLDGTGASGVNINLEKNAIWVIDLQFLAFGRVRLCVDYNGDIIPFYSFNNAFNQSTPYMQTASLPVAMVVKAASSANAKTAYFKCAAVESEGGISDADAFGFSTPLATETAGNATRTHLLSIRPKTTFNGIVNRELFSLTGINLVVTGNETVYWELVIGATMASSTWADVNASSGFEYTSVRGSFTNLTNGLVLLSGFAGGRGGGTNPVQVIPIEVEKIVSAKYPITLDRNGAVRSLGTLTLLVQGLTATSSCTASFNYKEVR